ncbi:MAG: RNA-binding transcriptional accessory protein [Sedimentisphaerales bacterium]|nr:RNA-binding transcriptional accessory protein [Sedimentisphaerales bacterium]
MTENNADMQVVVKDYSGQIASELGVKRGQVAATLVLLADDATVPFIARYRKEATGSLDEVAITAIRDRVEQLRELDKRRETILKSLEDQGKLTDELKGKVEGAETMTLLEDIYLPYRPKRRTRATIAREKGLEPLAELVFGQEDFDVAAKAGEFVDEEKGVATTEDALAGARDIIAEWVNEDGEARQEMRELYAKRAMVVTKVIAGKEEEGAKFKDYFEWEELLSKAPSHRVLAMRRGEDEGVLSMRVVVEEEAAVGILERLFVKAGNDAAGQVKLAIGDCFKRLMSISMATEARLESKKRADEKAVAVFADNLRQLLLAAPLGQKNVMGVDPGFRTGCKVVCMDRQGKLLCNDVFYLPQVSSADAAAGQGAKIAMLCEKYEIEAIAIGNGTASRETEAFIRELKLPGSILITQVNESGASVYSASPVAREEFPDKDVTVRGAVSIGRRLMDPLAELVKIDPKSIGVGQYQHDVDQNLLKTGLDDVVISCVNSVGVEVNTASKQLLSYVSGLGPMLAGNVVKHRDENGAFKSRKELLKVARLGPKAFEQAAGFLRVRGADNPLDESAVHPESYKIVDTMASDLQCGVRDLMASAELRSKIELKRYVTEGVGLPTLSDIMAELAKPGRDPREKFEMFSFAEGVERIEDLQVGMKLPGIVTNVTAFGAFVDIGVHNDGLVHISQLADRYVSDPNEVVKVQQKVMVTVMEIDLERKRVALSMKAEPFATKAEAAPKREAKPALVQENRGGGGGKRQSGGGNVSGGLRLGDMISKARKKR